MSINLHLGVLGGPKTKRLSFELFQTNTAESLALMQGSRTLTAHEGYGRYEAYARKRFPEDPAFVEDHLSDLRLFLKENETAVWYLM